MYGRDTMNTKEQKAEFKAARKAAKKQLIKKQARFKHAMEVTRTSCSFLALMLNLWVVYHVYLKTI